MEKCVDVMKKRVEDLEKKNRELEKSKKMAELQLAANESLMRLIKKQMEEKTTFYNNALQSFMNKDRDEANLLLETNEKIVVSIRSKRSRTSVEAA
ncbi:hypothetical protein DCAR_0206988 [Daucus carota subsp. sativus]|uniref:Uncharacterized protein n=1 Tax=Daucus carota subsp. sativus TaxID=79200 RepID=A0A166DKL6_DAUCS|nr:hypothetical protein DCAR_0206988 [Daucus carota subsp. sativus]